MFTEECSITVKTRYRYESFALLRILRKVIEYLHHAVFPQIFGIEQFLWLNRTSNIHRSTVKRETTALMSFQLQHRKK